MWAWTQPYVPIRICCLFFSEWGQDSFNQIMNIFCGSPVTTDRACPGKGRWYCLSNIQGHKWDMCKYLGLASHFSLHPIPLWLPLSLPWQPHSLSCFIFVFPSSSQPAFICPIPGLQLSLLPYPWDDHRKQSLIGLCGGQVQLYGSCQEAGLNCGVIAAARLGQVVWIVNLQWLLPDLVSFIKGHDGVGAFPGLFWSPSPLLLPALGFALQKARLGNIVIVGFLVIPTYWEFADHSFLKATVLFVIFWEVLIPTVCIKFQIFLQPCREIFLAFP